MTYDSKINALHHFKAPHFRIPALEFSRILELTTEKHFLFLHWETLILKNILISTLKQSTSIDKKV